MMYHATLWLSSYHAQRLAQEEAARLRRLFQEEAERLRRSRSLPDGTFIVSDGPVESLYTKRDLIFRRADIVAERHHAFICRRQAKRNRFVESTRRLQKLQASADALSFRRGRWSVVVSLAALSRALRRIEQQPGGTSPSVDEPPKSSGRRIFCLKNDGTPCGAGIRSGKFCHLHKSQDPLSYSSRSSETKATQSS